MASSRVLPITPVALEQEIARLLRRYTTRDERVLLIRADPSWTGPSEIAVEGRRATIVGCVSPLAVLEQVTEHLDRDDSMLVVLTPVEESALGTGLLSRVIRQRIFMVEPWRVVEESFGAQQIDPGLTAEGWAAEALIDAMPWPRLTGTILTRDTALRHLATRRLGLDRLGMGPGDLGPHGLLLWSTDASAVEAFRHLREAERVGLTAWLRETVGNTADILFRLVEADRGGDALALGIVCGALWHPDAESMSARAQGAVLTYISTSGMATVEDAAIRDFGSTAELIVGWLLREKSSAQEKRLAHATLERAEDLVIQFGAQSAVRFSNLLRSGFEARLDDVAQALTTVLSSPTAMPALAASVDRLREHSFAGTDAHRVRRAEMAQRLVQWLATPYDARGRVTGVEAALQAQIDEWGWVDRAHDDIWMGEHLNPTLKKAYGKLHALVRERRRGLDEAFVAKLAAWTESWSPSGHGDVLTVETLLPRVVAPLVTGKSGRPVLLVVLDGMSAAVASELAEDLREQRWEEYDPVGVGAPRRRAVVAALPTVTRVSRASLLSARLTRGWPDDERKAFESHPFWGGRQVRLFHKGALPGDAGELLDDDLANALGDPSIHVAVVLNTIDDTLDKGRGRVDDIWRIEDVAMLRALLDYARYQGRAVILTSDHGHVLERGSTLRSVPDSESGRHRAPLPPVSEGEIELVGPRVVAVGNRIIAAWDPCLRYAPERAGYHGGASLAEVTIPLLAFLPLGAAVPKGWRALPEQRPEWWTLKASLRTGAVESTEAAEATKAAGSAKTARTGKTEGAVKSARRKTPKAPEPDGAALFEMPVPGEALEADLSLVDELLGTELFKDQHRLMPRKVATSKISAVLQALLDAGGPLPLPVVAEAAGEPPVRAAGLIATLQRILNVDNYPVLSVVDNGRSARLDAHLLREQFGLKGR